MCPQMNAKLAFTCYWATNRGRVCRTEMRSETGNTFVLIQLSPQSKIMLNYSIYNNKTTKRKTIKWPISTSSECPLYFEFIVNIIDIYFFHAI